jgi:hypothetical protein
MDLAKHQQAMQQAAKMREEMERKLAEITVEGSAGGGMVTVRMDGRKVVQSIRIEPAALAATSQSDIEMLQDLITAAFNDAGRKADEAAKGSMKGLLGGMLPGI